MTAIPSTLKAADFQADADAFHLSPFGKTLDAVCGYFLGHSGDPCIAMSGSGVEIPNFGRLELASMFAELGLNRGAEIGVKCGEYSEVLLKANPNLHLFGIDPFLSYEAYRIISQERQDQCRTEALDRLGPYIKAGRYTLIEKPSVEAAKTFAEGVLQFVYIDASHKFEDVVADIAAWSSLLGPGTIVAGHDYLMRKHGRDGGPNVSHHVKQAVDAYTSAYGIDPWYVLGRYGVREGEVRDKERSWLWVKR